MAGGRRGGRGNVGKRRREEEEYIAQDFASQHPNYDPELGTQGFPEYGYGMGTDKSAIGGGLAETHGNRMERLGGMLSGAWDKVKGVGKHLAENNPISLRMQEVQAGVDAYDNYWLTRLGHEGTPLKEDYNNEKDWENDYRQYWDERPLDYTWFKHYGD